MLSGTGQAVQGGCCVGRWMDGRWTAATTTPVPGAVFDEPEKCLACDLIDGRFRHAGHHLQPQGKTVGRCVRPETDGGRSRG
ncbi:hypothetical protein ADK55_27675 [Streptomyces sp. WM4235]|nr:hypothetical protein ADK55_27675 [Streptomyces sp. WM4235]